MRSLLKPRLPAQTSVCRSPSAKVPSVIGHHRRPLVVCRTAGELTSGAAAATTLPVDAPNQLGSASPAPSTVSPSEDARAIVDQVLEAIKDTDSGISISAAQRAHVDSLLERLEAIGAQQQPRPLDNPLLWGNYNVAYTSVGKQERGEPAGGRFRGRIGRSLFRTAGLFQSVLQPDLATNKVEFRLFGVLPGHVGLRGQVLPVGETGDTVQVLFEPPVLSIADKVFLRIGGVSTVTLSTTYLDERVRLGKGSRGSLFVFTRGGAADQAGMDQVGLQRTSLTSAAAFSAFFVSLFLGGAALWVSGQLLLKAAALAMWLLGAAVGSVVRRGGLVLDRQDERQVAQLRAELERKKQQMQQAAQRGQGQGSGGAGAAPPSSPAPAAA